MKDVERRLERFTFYDHTGIEAHLEKMAAEGWMLEKIPYLWHYRRCEPRNVKFCVTYYPRASVFDPGPTEGELDFHAYCERTGWKLAASNAQLQIFYNEDPDATPIETDPVMEVDTLHRTAKRTFLPTYFVLLAAVLFNLWLFVGEIVQRPIELLSSPLRLYTGVLWVLVLLLCAVTVGGYFRWRRRAIQAAERGEFIATPNHSKFQGVCLAVAVLAFAYWLFCYVWQGDRLTRIVFPLMIGWVLVIFFGTRLVMNFLKKKKVSKNVNRVVTFGGISVLSYALMFGIIIALVSATSRGLLPTQGDGDVERYEYQGQVWYLYRDEIPLRIEDMMEVDYDDYITTFGGDDSLFLSRYEAEQSPRFDAEDFKDIPTLDYEVVSVKMPFLYGWCRDAIYRERDETNDDRVPEELKALYQPVDPAPWGAAEAYELVYQDADWASNRFLLCYDRRIVSIHFDWTPTAEQMAIVGEKLGG